MAGTLSAISRDARGKRARGGRERRHDRHFPTLDNHPSDLIPFGGWCEQTRWRSDKTATLAPVHLATATLIAHHSHPAAGRSPATIRRQSVVTTAS
jgi:hypothetical protein